MKAQTVALFFLYAMSGCTAAPATYTITEVTANYDNLTAEEPSVGSIEAYEGLFYNAWDIAGTPKNATGGVVAHSLPNKIISGPQDERSHGIPSFSILPPYTSLRLLDFYFGCATRSDESYSNTAFACTITVSAFTQTDDQKPVAVANFTFVPNPLNSSRPVELTRAVLPCEFARGMGVSQVTVVPNQEARDGLVVDDLHYELVE